jgi:hypothetical protein
LGVGVLLRSSSIKGQLDRGTNQSVDTAVPVAA